MPRTLAGTLLLPDNSPLQNAQIHLTAKRVEPSSILTGINTSFTTNSSGAYTRVVVDGWYQVAIEYLDPVSGSNVGRRNLGDIVVENNAASATLNSLLIASNPPEDPNLGIFYDILAQTQLARDQAATSAASAAASAASITIGTAPTNIPNNTILNTRLGTTENLGSAAQRTVGTAAANIPDTDQLNVRLGTSGNLGNAAQRSMGTGGANISDNTQLNTRLGTSGNLGNASQADMGTGPTNIPNTTILNTRLGTSGNLGDAALATVTNSATDTASGKVWRTNDLVKQLTSHTAISGAVAVNNAVGGFFGIGAMNPGVPSSMQDASDEIPTGFFRVNVTEGSTDRPTGIDYGPLINARFSSATSVKIAAATGADIVSFRRTGGSWRQLWHDGNLPYETGSFTPTSFGGTTAGSATYTSQAGRYTKIGNRVDFSLVIGWSAHTGTGLLNIGGLPFTSVSSSPSSALSLYYDGLTVGAGKSLSAIIGSNSTSFLLRACDVAGGSAASTGMDTSVYVLNISGTYFTSS